MKQESKKFNVDLISKLLNEIFSLNTVHNERMLDAFILENDIDFGGSEEEDSS